MPFAAAAELDEEAAEELALELSVPAVLVAALVIVSAAVPLVDDDDDDAEPLVDDAVALVDSVVPLLASPVLTDWPATAALTLDE